MCTEKIVTDGSGATEYFLSYGNNNGPASRSMPDTEGGPTDGSVNGSDFEPQSICCAVAF